jgi:hypothetical protein
MVIRSCMMMRWVSLILLLILLLNDGGSIPL